MIFNQEREKDLQRVERVTLGPVYLLITELIKFLEWDTSDHVLTIEDVNKRKGKLVDSPTMA